MQSIDKFNIRVYGVLVENNKLLIVEECYKQREITKLPGGGMNPGEGTIECLCRELKEELNIDIEVKNHFYTTDFFQQSVFRGDEQILSIYYIIKRKHPTQPINYSWQEVANEHKIKFRWIELNNVDEGLFTFPIDKKVSTLISNTKHWV